MFGPLDQPVAGARVAFFAADAPAGGTPLAQRWSGADGTFEASGLPPPPYSITVDHVDYAQARDRVDALAGPVALHLVEGRRLQGRIVERGSAQPLSGIQVLLQDAGRTWVATSEQGRFEFQNISPGDYELSTRSDGHEDVSLPWQVPEGNDPQPDLQLELIRFGIVEGVVVDRLGRPVPRARVVPDAKHSAGVWSDREGRFRLAGLLPGQVRLSASHDTAGAATDDQATEVRSGETTPGVVLRLPEVDRSPAPADPPAPASDEAPADEAPVQRMFTLPAVELRWDEGPVVARVAGTGQSPLRPGDRLLTIDGERVLSLAQARSMLRGAPGSRVVVRVRRSGQAKTLRLARPGR